MTLTQQAAKDAAEQYQEEGYAILRGFVDGDELTALQSETRHMYEEGLKHHATFRHGNLAFEILPERDFGQRYVIQAYWMSWISSYFERFRRSDRYLTLLEPILGCDIKQIAQQIHWKPPGAHLTGYRWHQDLRFRPNRDAFRDIERASVTAGLAVDPSTRDNGCLRVIPKSQKLGYLGLSDEGDGQIMKGMSSDDQLRTVGLDPSDIVWLELDPGDLALWGLMTVHGSLPNNSEHDRAFALSSYVRANTTERGEWAFRGGVSTPLGEAPRLCKYEALHERPEPHYVDDRWYA